MSKKFLKLEKIILIFFLASISQYSFSKTMTLTFYGKSPINLSSLFSEGMNDIVNELTKVLDNYEIRNASNDLPDLQNCKHWKWEQLNYQQLMHVV